MIFDHDELTQAPRARAKTYKETAEQLTVALQSNAYREGITKVISYIDAARSCFAIGLLKKGKERDRELTIGAEVLERMLKEVCDDNEVKLPDFPDGIRKQIDEAHGKKE